MEIAAFASFAVLLIAWVAAPSAMAHKGTLPSVKADDAQPISGYQGLPESAHST
jgi:hypothetical protein